MPKSREMVVAAFLVQIDIREAGCWPWEGRTDPDGYGLAANGARNGLTRAPKFMWELVNGCRVPEGMLVCHHCDNPPCLRPDHLFLDTISGNNRDKWVKGRQPMGAAVKNSKLTEAQVLAILADPRVYREIAGEYGVSESNISHIKNQRNWKHVEFVDDAVVIGQRKGSAAPTARLTEADIPKIRADTRSYAVIGADYGVSGSLIGRVKRGEAWKHV